VKIPNRQLAAAARRPCGIRSLSGGHGLKPMRAHRINRSYCRDSDVQPPSDRTRQTTGMVNGIALVMGED
jgi:hypothetical protein